MAADRRSGSLTRPVDHDRTPPPGRPVRRPVAAAVVAAVAMLVAAATGSTASAEEAAELVVEPDTVAIGESFTVANAQPDCTTEVSVAVDELGLWAPDVQPDEHGFWVVEFTVPTEDVPAGTHEVGATCIVTGSDGTFHYAPAAITVEPVAEAPFPDVPPWHPFHEEISWLADAGIASGYADGLFRPTDALSRQGAAAFLYRAAGAPHGADPGCTADQFPDVRVDHPFCGEIGWLVTEGITGGYADGTFRPGTPLSRQAAAAFLFQRHAAS